MRKWCFPGNIFHMRKTDEHCGVEISILKIIHLQELMIMTSED